MADVRSATGPEITAADLYALLRLRVNVFVVEQECAYPELDGLDLLPGTCHLWLAEGDTLLGCLRIIDDGGGVLRVGRVCASAAARGTGVGARLMTAALDVIGDAESVLGAQTYATGFYERFGYRTEGEPYDEDGIPHITMRRVLSR
ncbi:GNAT family N-acetyltransferase [Haloechinothrix salitolerans]|uniref:GNAT family N-acetyltransferase n=1 Tax=Haloechinothrix salitolerans TaxID=926830 RepID=A0ABW2C3C9_9PSEU